MRPWSCLSRPRQSLRMVLLPEPATPSTTLVSPRRNSKETPSSTGESSKLMETSSKMIALCTVSRDLSSSSNIVFFKQGHGGSAQGDEELRQDGIDKQDQHRSHHHGLRG